MTANEMKFEAEVLYDRIASAGAPGYSDAEWSVIFTKAQETFLRGIFSPYNSVQETEQRRKEFQNLVTAATITTSSASQTGVHTNGTFFDLPSDLLWTLYEEVIISSADPCKNNLALWVKPVTEDEYNSNIDNPHKKPYCNAGYGLVWRMDFNTRRHELITDGSFTVSQYKLRYLRLPQDIIPFTNDGTTTAMQDCELDSIAHRPIIEIAVRIATGITTPEQYQIKLNEEKLNQ